MKDLRTSVEAATEAEYRGLFDPATRLAKPALLRDRLEIALARAARHQRHVGLLFVSVDVPPDLIARRGSNFDVLPLISGRLRSAVRPDDTVARVGEHEFVVVVNDLVEVGGLDLIANRLHDVVGVRVFLDESKSVLSARIDSCVGRPGDRALDLLLR